MAILGKNAVRKQAMLRIFLVCSPLLSLYNIYGHNVRGKKFFRGSASIRKVRSIRAKERHLPERGGALLSFGKTCQKWRAKTQLLNFRGNIKAKN